MIDESFLVLRARAGDSSISTTWLAGTISTFGGIGPPGNLGNSIWNSDQQDRIGRMGSRPRQRASDYLQRRVIAAHRVDGYSDGAAIDRADR